MSNEVTCPNCQAVFDVFDLNESCEYECPECFDPIWIEVEYTPSYYASCLPDDHDWQPEQEYSVTYNYRRCSKCGAMKVKEKEDE